VRRASLALALVATALLAAPGARASRVSLPAIERQVMCVTCKIPLDEAQSPQAAREKAFIAGLIAQGRSEAQIKDALVSQYGPTVLALPRAKGFDATVYVVPIVVVLALAGLLAVLLPTWRRRARAKREQAPEATPQLSAADTARLDADMARFD
jgi:cytochrome c-type biogenesis protein CcmH